MGGTYKQIGESATAKPVTNASFMLDLLGIAKGAPSYEFIDPSAFECDKNNAAYLKKQGIGEYNSGDLIACRKGVLFDLESSILSTVNALLSTRVQDDPAPTPAPVKKSRVAKPGPGGSAKKDTSGPLSKNIETGTLIEGKGFLVASGSQPPDIKPPARL